MCHFRRFAESGHESADHDLDQENYASLDIQGASGHARVPASRDFVRYHEQMQSADIEIRFRETSRLFGGIRRLVLKCHIRQTMARGLRVVLRAMRPFPAVLLPVKLNNRIIGEYHPVF
jgi:hypothetical protein